MKIIVSFLFVVLTLFSSEYKEKDTIDRYSFVDQYDRVKTLQKQTKAIIYTNASNIDLFKSYIKSMGKDFIKKKKLIVLYNASNFIPLVFKFYTLPSLRSLKFEVTLDYTNKNFSKENKNIVIYLLNDFKITQILKVNDLASLHRACDDL